VAEPYISDLFRIFLGMLKDRKRLSGKVGCINLCIKGFYLIRLLTVGFAGRVLPAVGYIGANILVVGSLEVCFLLNSLGLARAF
jgi:hypothetical protein